MSAIAPFDLIIDLTSGIVITCKNTNSDGL